MSVTESIDVVMCTWNSNKPYFRKCLLSIKRGVSVHHLILVDRFSSDGTVEVVRDVFEDAMIFETAVNLAMAREIGVANVDTKYFAFIDDDIEISKSWFASLISVISSEKHVGAVQGFIRYYMDYMDKAQEFELGRRREHTKEINERGYTHNTILRTEIVRDFSPNEMVSSWEDFLLTQHVIRKGYKWLETDQAQVTHYRNVDLSFLTEIQNNFLRAKWNGAGDRIVRNQSNSCIRAVLSLLSKSLMNLVYYLAITILVSDPRVFSLQLPGNLGYLKGFLSANENVVPYELHIDRN